MNHQVIFVLATVLFSLTYGKVLPPKHGRIVNGEDTDHKPYHVVITARNGISSLSGAGILITNRHILTVASLIRFFNSWTIGYGGTVLGELTNATSSFAFIHPLYDETTSPRTSDIGVIILPTPLNNNSSYKMTPIDLPPTVMDLPRINEEGTIVGFSTDGYLGDLHSNATLKSAYLMVHPKSECLSDAEDTFCASNAYYNANVCNSDVGSAFAIHYRGGIVLAGMTTSSTNWCDISDKSNYLRIQSYLPWLQAVTYGA